MEKLSRRGFLLGGSAVLAAAAVPALPAHMPGMTSDLLRAAKAAALGARPRIRPIYLGPRDYYFLIANPGSREALLLNVKPGERRLEHGILLVGAENGCG